MFDRLWDLLVHSLILCFMPLVCSYYAISANVFINVSAQNAGGLEWTGNMLLSPVQYVLAGWEARPKPDGSWELIQRFDYKESFWIKTAASFLILPSSLVLGTSIKGLSFFDQKTRKRHQSILAHQYSKEVHSNEAEYRSLGIEVGESKEMLISQRCKRRAGDERVLADEKEALADIANVLNETGILWWVDCGTCLGSYRYGGVIPWDEDIDIAVLLPDFENVQRALRRLDPKKYIVQDWSTRDYPNSYIKVFIRKSGTLIDIYHFAIDRENRELRYVFSLGSNLFFPEWWKIRERRFEAPVAFETVFPLKKAELDGIDVFVPNDTKKYLQRCYGENLDPVKVYNEETDAYEKDLTHPYWQRAYAH